jgi:hypothetical protein
MKISVCSNSVSYCTKYNISMTGIQWLTVITSLTPLPAQSLPARGNNWGGGYAFDTMSAAAWLYSPQQQQTCWHRTALDGNDTVLVDQDLYSYICKA